MSALSSLLFLIPSTMALLSASLTWSTCNGYSIYNTPHSHTHANISITETGNLLLWTCMHLQFINQAVRLKLTTHADYIKIIHTCLFCTCSNSLFCSNNSFCTFSSCFLFCFSILCPRFAPNFPLRAASCRSLSLSRLFSRPSSSALCAASS